MQNHLSTLKSIKHILKAGERRAELRSEQRQEGFINKSEFNFDYCVMTDSDENVHWDNSGDDDNVDCDKSDNIVLCDGDNINVSNDCEGIVMDLDDNGEDDWESGEKGYSPIKSQLRHNLDQMHLEVGGNI